MEYAYDAELRAWKGSLRRNGRVLTVIAGFPSLESEPLSDDERKDAAQVLARLDEAEAGMRLYLTDVVSTELGWSGLPPGFLDGEFAIEELAIYRNGDWFATSVDVPLATQQVQARGTVRGGLSEVYIV